MTLAHLDLTPELSRQTELGENPHLGASRPALGARVRHHGTTAPRHQARRRISAGDAVRAEPVAAHLRAPRHLGTFRALGPDQWPISKCLTPSSCSRAAATSHDTARHPTLFLICSTSGAGGLTKTRLSLRGVTASNLDANHALATSWPQTTSAGTPSAPSPHGLTVQAASSSSSTLTGRRVPGPRRAERRDSRQSTALSCRRRRATFTTA